MSKARDIANILSANTAIATDAEVSSAVSAAVSTHATAVNGHIGRGSTANRPASPTIGDTYFDTTLAALISYTSLGWVKVSQDPAPQIASISPTTAATTGTTVTITGSGFKPALLVKFIGTNLTEYDSPVVGFVSATTATATTPILPVAYEPYDVKVINNDNQFAILDNCLDSGGSPVWSTASGNIATLEELNPLSTLVSATDPDGTSIVYSSSDLPSWISLNTSNGALSGTAPSVSSDTTYTFSVSATDGVNSSSRSFNVAVTNNVILGISGLHSWYDASVSSSITSSGGNITQWSDLSGNSRHAVLSGGGSSPTIGSVTQNSKNVVSFNGVNQYLVAPASLTSNSMTIFSVYKRNSGSGTGTYGRLFSFWGANSLDYSSTASWEVHTSAQSFGGITPPLVGLYRNSAQVAGSTISYGTAYLFSGTLDGGNWSQNNSGVVVTGTTSTDSINVSNNTLGAGMATGGGDAYFTGWFAEQIIYNRVLTPSEISSVRTYLSNKWGVS